MPPTKCNTLWPLTLCIPAANTTQGLGLCPVGGCWGNAGEGLQSWGGGSWKHRGTSALPCFAFQPGAPLGLILPARHSLIPTPAMSPPSPPSASALWGMQRVMDVGPGVTH